jgi:hypothetical protein
MLIGQISAKYKAYGTVLYTHIIIKKEAYDSTFIKTGNNAIETGVERLYIQGSV